MTDPQNFGLRLSEPIAQGDWRLVFLQHSRLKDISARRRRAGGASSI